MIDEFRSLAERTRDKPFFGMLSVSTKAYQDRIVIEWNWLSRWFIALLMGGFGLFFLVGAFFFFGDDKLSTFLSFIGFAIGILITFLVFKFLTMAERITLNLNAPTINIRYGSFPFPKRLDIDKNQLELKIYNCPLQHAYEVIGPGNTILSFFEKDKPDVEFVIVVASHAKPLKPLYEKLNKYFEQSDTDATLQKLELSEGKFIRYSTAVLTGKLEQKQRDLQIPSKDKAIFKRGKKHFFIWLVSIAMGVLFLSLPFWVVEEMKDALYISLLTTPVGGFCLISGICFLIRVWRTRYLVVDKKNDALWYKSSLENYGYSKKIGVISEIAAIQICSVWTDITAGTVITQANVYELNVIGKRKTDDRNNIYSDTNREKILNDATKFAEFLSLPLIDNTYWSET